MISMNEPLPPKVDLGSVVLLNKEINDEMSPG